MFSCSVFGWHCTFFVVVAAAFLSLLLSALNWGYHC